MFKRQLFFVKVKYILITYFPSLYMYIRFLTLYYLSFFLQVDNRPKYYGREYVDFFALPGNVLNVEFISVFFLFIVVLPYFSPNTLKQLLLLPLLVQISWDDLEGRSRPFVEPGWRQLPHQGESEATRDLHTGSKVWVYTPTGQSMSYTYLNISLGDF